MLLIDLLQIYEEKLKGFFQECVYSNSDMAEHHSYSSHIFLFRHMHEDEEIRYILSGGGFFDVRGTSGLTM